MSNENLVSGILWLLGVATVFLLTTAVAMAMARDGVVLWDDATDAVRALSTLCTMMVGAVGVVHVMSGRTKRSGKE